MKHLKATIGTLVLAATLPAMAWAESVQGPDVGALLKVIFGLLAVVAVIFVLSRVLPRMSGFRGLGSRDFRVLSTLPVGQKERIVLLQAGDRQILVGVTAQSINALHLLDQPIEIDDRQAGAGVSGNWLQKSLGGRQ